jgi:hypothetical protein
VTSYTSLSDRMSPDSHTYLLDIRPTGIRSGSIVPYRSAWVAQGTLHTEQAYFSVPKNYLFFERVRTVFYRRDHFSSSYNRSLPSHANTIHHRTCLEVMCRQSKPTSIYIIVHESFSIYFFAGAFSFSASALALRASFLAFSF